MPPLVTHTLGNRRYHLLQPERSSGDLLLVLHGSRQSGKVFQRFSAGTFDRFARLGWMVCYPDGVAQHWNDDRVHLNERTRALGTDDVGFLEALCEHLGARRVYAAGFSNGGMMVLSMLYRRPGLVRAAALFSAPHPSKSNWMAPASWHPTALFCQHGKRDPVVPFSGGRAGMPGQDRGELLGFWESCELLAQANHATRSAANPARFEGQAPLEAWALPDEGHVIPTRAPVTSALLGPASASLDIGEPLQRFFTER